MSYLLRNKPKRKFPVKFIIAGILFLIFYLLLTFIPSGIKTTVYTISKPVWNVSEFVFKPFYLIGDYFKSKNSLITENLALKDEVTSLKLKESDYDAILKENDDLKNQFGRGVGHGRIIGRVLSRPPYSPYDTFVIDAGEESGIRLGSKVYISDSIVIGSVKNVTKKTSLIELYSSSGEKIEAIIQRTGASFEIEGMGGGNFKVDVPKDTDILWGDVFVYPSLSSSVLGSVYFIDTNAQSSFKSVYVRTPVNVFSSKYLFVENL